MGRILNPPKNPANLDLVYTPRELAKDIIDHFPLSGLILDPCKGDGAFYDQYPNTCQKDWCEIELGIDFFDYHKNVDWIISNPPWSKMREFINHSMEIGTNIVFLTTINHFMTKARMRSIFANGYGFKEIYGVPQPKQNWPASGFQLGAIHIQKDYKDSCIFTGKFGQ